MTLEQQILLRHHLLVNQLWLLITPFDLIPPVGKFPKALPITAIWQTNAVHRLSETTVNTPNTYLHASRRAVKMQTAA